MVRRLAVSLLAVALVAGCGGGEREQPAKPDPFETLFFANEGPTQLQGGLGALAFPVGTSSARAQRWFDQGLAQYYAFQDADAWRSFRRAAELDPKLAMAHWGAALAVGGDLYLTTGSRQFEIAQQELEKARRLEADASPRERAYIDALASRYAPKGSATELSERYAQAMLALHRRYPGDPHAATLFALAGIGARPFQQYPTPAMRPTPATREIVAALAPVVRRYPDFAGALHLWIHALEQSPDPGRALDAANRLGDAAPGLPHMLHMPSHIWVHVGRPAKILAANGRTFASLTAYRDRHGTLDFFELDEWQHDSRFVAVVQDASGFTEAKATADDNVEYVRPYLEQIPFLEENMPVPMLVRVHLQDWTGALALPKPAADLKMTTAFWHFGRGVAYASTGDLGRARTESAAMKRARKLVPAAQLVSLVSARDLLAIAQDVLDGRIARAERRHGAAVRLLEEAVRRQDALAYDEPEDFYPVRESLGAALLAAGRPGAAAAVFRADLARNPSSGRSLLGLAESLAAAGDRAGAARARAAFRRAWKTADARVQVRDF